MNTPALRLRLARESDLDAIVEIYNSTVPDRIATADLEPVSVDSRRAWFREHSADRHPLWVAERNGRIAGWCSLQAFHVRSAYRATVEISVYVHAQERRAGVARSLIKHALDAAPSLGVRNVLALIFGHNTPSLDLFTAFGFAPWGELPAVAELDGIERDVVILGLRITSTSAGR
ncbi:MAG TPA: GNAT family N-acetyltransferase [Polyangiales bacterium]|jgi:phosphinothricin acetyltransferase|nr:GNAT family N-acetyltransferase [Polyangiales bacterium]